MTDIIFPTTDGGVLIQLVVISIAFATIVFLLRRQPEWRVFGVGGWVLAYAFIGLRALH